MKLKANRHITYKNKSYKPGDTFDHDDPVQAQSLIKQGHADSAEPVEHAPEAHATGAEADPPDEK